MTETTTPPPGDRVEPVGLEVEMSRSYLDYAMSVIVGRALPDVRDGLKPVHRKVLYGMYDGGYRPDRGYVKCSRVVGDVMGQYHPHGDASIYDTLVRMAQPWSLRYPLIDGNGNFGSPGNDPAAAMRYCLISDTRIRTLDGGTIRIGEVAADAAPNSDTDIDLKVVDRNGDPVRASKLFHSGEHETLRLRTREGYEVTGTRNHPVLCLVSLAGVPTLLWKLLEEIEPGDFVAMQRTVAEEIGTPAIEDVEAAVLAGASGDRSLAKRVPEFVWKAVPAVKRAFLQSLFEGDGSCSLLPRDTVQISYSTRSDSLAIDVQQLLLEFGVVSKQVRYDHGEIKVVITNRRDARTFAATVGFLGRKQEKLQDLLATIPTDGSVTSDDRVPYLAEFVRAHGANRWTERDWLRRHNVDRIECWERRHDELAAHIANPEVLAVAESVADGRFYYASVEAVTEVGLQPVYSIRVESDDHAFVSNGFVSHNTECRLDPLAMEMVRDIDEDTVDMNPNYDGRATEPAILPARFPNLLVNGSAGIAVGMATNIPPHNLREVASGVQWCLDNPDVGEEETIVAMMARIKGPDFPTGALIVGTEGITDAQRTGRGSIRMRSIVEVEEDRRGRQMLVVTELPYQVNPDNLAERIAELVKEGKLAGIADIRDESSGRTGQRLVLVLKRDAVAKVVLNNLYKHTQLQDSFGVNMLAIVDGVPRTLNVAQMVRLYVAHQVEVIIRRTRYRLRKKEERAHILRGYLKALDALDEVIALIRASDTVEIARTGLMQLLEIDELQATAILDMQLRRLAALERQKITDEYNQLMADIAELEAILASDERQRQIIGEELAVIVEKYGDDRRTTILPYDGDVSMEDLIAEEPVVVTITRTGYAKRTKVDLYRSQRRGGKGVQGAALKQDDIVAHFFVCSTHDWILFFTNKGRVYRVKAYELPEASRAARGQHVANLLAFQPDEQIAEVIEIRTYDDAPHLVLATRNGLVKKTKLTEFDSNRQGGVIAINLRDGDELVGAQLINDSDDLLLVSRQAQAIRFKADDDTLRPMGRATSGVIGMRFTGEDELLSMHVARDGMDVLVATEGGFAKRTPIEEYPVQGRGGKGVVTARIVSKRGRLIAALAVTTEDELFAITSNGGVIRTPVRQVRRTRDRNTMGVKLMELPAGVTLVAIARNEDEPEGQDGA